MTDDDNPEVVDKDAAKEAIYYALNSEYCVLEFSEVENGDIHIADITDHVEQLEKMHVNSDTGSPLDLRTVDNE